MSIFVTGDNHANLARYSSIFLPDEFGESTSENLLLVAGDWGFLWDNEDKMSTLQREREKNLFNHISKAIGDSNRLLVVPGNHENYNRIEQLDEITLYGAKARQLNDNIFFAERGEIFSIPDKTGNAPITVFTLGGAFSSDRPRRILNESYWAQEIPTHEELEYALSNLKAHGNKVDYIVSHQGPMRLLRPFMGEDYDPHEEELQATFEYIVNNVNFKRWLYAHHHKDCSYTSRYQCCYINNYLLA